MTIPQLPEDVLVEILSHFFYIRVDAPPPSNVDDDGWDFTPPRGPTAIGQSTPLLLVNRQFKSLAEPLLWRIILVDRPSDFLLFFSPKTGLLNTKGELGEARRRWVTQLVLGRDAALPYDKAKIRKNLRSPPARKKTYDLHADLVTPKLPNLRRLVLGETAYVAPSVVEDDPSYEDLIERFDVVTRFSEQEVDEESGYPFEDFLIDIYPWFWADLAVRNDKLIAKFLAPLAPGLEELRAPFAPSAQWTDVPMDLETRWTLTARLPWTLADAKGLRVVLRSHDSDRGFRSDSDILPTLSQVRRLAVFLPRDATVEVHETEWTVSVWEWQGRPKVTVEADEWKQWTWVDQKGSRTLFGPEMLTVSGDFGLKVPQSRPRLTSDSFRITPAGSRR